MRTIRRWCALVLAIALVGTNAVYQLKTTLSAHEAEQTVEVDDESREAAAKEATKAVIEKVTGETVDMNNLSAKELVEAMEANAEETQPEVEVTVVAE